MPVAAWKFRDPRRGMAIVAAAGPAMNFFLAWLGALALHLICGHVNIGDQCLSWLATDVLGSTNLEPTSSEFLARGIFLFVTFNLVLGLFNLLPIPPLDGGRIAVGLLPEALALRWARLERVGIVIIMLAVFILPEVLRQFGTEFNPVNGLLNGVLLRAIDITLQLAGVHAAT